MDKANFRVKQDEEGTHHITGELTIHEIDDLKEFLEACFGAGQVEEIAVSLSEVRFMDTAALQLFIVFRKWLEPEVRFRIADVSAEVEEILKLCGLKAALL